jgi:hypothetical protein
VRDAGAAQHLIRRYLTAREAVAGSELRAAQGHHSVSVSRKPASLPAPGLVPTKARLELNDCRMSWTPCRTSSGKLACTQPKRHEEAACPSNNPSSTQQLY